MVAAKHYRVSSDWNNLGQEWVQPSPKRHWGGISVWCSLRNVSQGRFLYIPLFASHLQLLIFDIFQNENRREEKIEERGYNYLLQFFDYQTERESYIIWAFTAAILITAASLVYERPPAFEDHRPKFWSGSRLWKLKYCYFIHHLYYACLFCTITFFNICGDVVMIMVEGSLFFILILWNFCHITLLRISKEVNS